ncbi:MAG TPA: hypothetical protein VHO92_03960, partial [Methanobacterium sp.]|nr:hypothetical protein [Methanobacterium sp.]
MADKEMKLKVAEAISQSDVGRSIARIDPACMQELGLVDGDIVEIEGKKLTAATAASSQSDIGLGIIRIDGHIRKNVGASIGEEITVTRADTKKSSLEELLKKLSSDKGGISSSEAQKRLQ